MWFLFGFIVMAALIALGAGLLWLAGFLIMLPFAVIKQVIRIMRGD